MIKIDRRAPTEQNTLLRERVEAFCRLRGCKPGTVIRLALGYDSKQLARWLTNTKHKMRPVTMLKISEWLDRNQDYKPIKGRPKSRVYRIDDIPF